MTDLFDPSVIGPQSESEGCGDAAPWRPRGAHGSAEASRFLLAEEAGLVVGSPPEAALARVREACEAAMEACRDLASRGCVVLAAHAVQGRPRVVVAPPAPGARLAGSKRRWDRREITYSTTVQGVLVEWSERRRASAQEARP